MNQPTRPLSVDEILEDLIANAFIFGNLALGKVTIPPVGDTSLPPKDQAKAQLIELVKKCKPQEMKYVKPAFRQGWNRSADIYEQALIKAIEGDTYEN